MSQDIADKKAKRAAAERPLDHVPGADRHKFLWDRPAEQMRASIAAVRLEMRYIEEGLRAIEAVMGEEAAPEPKSRLGPNQQAGPSAGRRRRG